MDWLIALTFARHGLRSVPLLDLTGTRLGAGSLDFGYGKKG